MQQDSLVQTFQPLINKLSQQYINVTVGEDDLRQQLWQKVIELMPKMKDLDSEYSFKYIKACLNNLIKDIKYHESRIPGSSHFSLVDMDFSDLLGDEVDNIFERMAEHNQEDDAIGSELKTLVLKWAENQPATIKRFINERIKPSDEMEDAWQERLKISPRCKNARDIPIWSMLKILDINEKVYYKKIGVELADYLKHHGFQNEQRRYVH